MGLRPPMARIIATDVHVEFPVYDVRNRSLKSAVLRAATGGLIARDAHRHVLVKALDGVSFELKDGDRVGLIGHNGSGKSTLLRVLAGAFEPVRGRVVVEGRVQAVGFRAFVEDEAAARGLTGWVRNLRSGQVEMVLSGNDTDIQSMIAACRKGPRFASVTRVETSPVPDEGWRDFTMRPTA